MRPDHLSRHLAIVLAAWALTACQSPSTGADQRPRELAFLHAFTPLCYLERSDGFHVRTQCQGSYEPSVSLSATMQLPTETDMSLLTLSDAILAHLHELGFTVTGKALNHERVMIRYHNHRSIGYLEIEASWQGNDRSFTFSGRETRS